MFTMMGPWGTIRGIPWTLEALGQFTPLSYWLCSSVFISKIQFLCPLCMNMLEERRVLGAGGPDLSVPVLETGLCSTDLHRSLLHEGHIGQNRPSWVKQGRQSGSKAEKRLCLQRSVS